MPFVPLFHFVYRHLFISGKKNETRLLKYKKSSNNKKKLSLWCSNKVRTLYCSTLFCKIRSFWKDSIKAFAHGGICPLLFTTRCFIAPSKLLWNHEAQPIPIWHRGRELNLCHSGERRALSPLRHPRFPPIQLFASCRIDIYWNYKLTLICLF
jgi:hypothetical protein